MVSIPKLSEEIRARIAEELGPALEALTAMVPLEGEPALGESVPVLLLTLEAIRAVDGGPLADRLDDDGRWHHQIYVGDAVPAYARSEPQAGGGEPMNLAEVSHSPLPSTIRAAMAWIDESVPDEGEARLVTVPSHDVVALWLDGPTLDHVVVLHAPNRLEGFEQKTVIGQDEFLAALAQTPAIPGVGLRTDIEGTGNDGLENG